MPTKKKWAHLRGTYPNLPDDPSRRELRDADRAAVVLIVGNTWRPGRLEEIVQLYNIARDEKDAIAKQEKENALRIETVERLLLEHLEHENLESIATGGRRFSRTDEPYPVVEDEEKTRQWCADQEIKMMIPHQTLKAMTKESLLAGDELPDGVNVFMKTTIRRT